MTPTPTCKINLALQGGGSHGALTWGVLDALLEDGSLVFDGISGTSAEAMNAVALAQGDRKSTRLNSSHLVISYAVFCLKKKKKSYDNRDCGKESRRDVRNDAR